MVPDPTEAVGRVYSQRDEEAVDVSDAAGPGALPRGVFRRALAPEDRERLPFYAALLARMDNDETARALLARAPERQRNPMLILAALNLEAMSGHAALAPIYQSVIAGEVDPDDAAAQVVDVLVEEPTIVSARLSRRTQTNEVGRSAVIQAVVADLFAPGASIDVIDLGCSAGLNLWFDHFRVSDVDDGDPFTLVCVDDGVMRGTLPRVVERVGLDVDPVDLADDESREWLRACCWPEQPERLARLDAVLALCSQWPATTLVKGDLAAGIDSAVALTDPSRPLLVTTTWVGSYLDEATRERLVDHFDELARSRSFAWVSIDTPHAPWPGVEVVAPEPERGASVVVARAPGEEARHWGWCHPHGRWLTRVTEERHRGR